MTHLSCAGRVVALFAGAALAAAAPAQSLIDDQMVLHIGGRTVFPIGFTMPPPPGGKTPSGRNAIEELASAGATFMRTGAMGGPWDKATIEREQQWLDAAQRHGLYCMPYLREHSVVRDDAGERELRSLVERFKNHPALGAWKGDDEPEWANRPVDWVERAYRIIKEVDPERPVVLIHAPRGTVESLRKYNSAADIIGTDIYPIGYPPGNHSLRTNKTMTLVGDYARTMREVSDGKKPVWMVLQIAWSGVIKPGKTLRMPTFFEERFMTYQAIINGARGLLYFGGSIPAAMNQRDKALGWNWTFWDRVLRPVIEEIGSHSPLYPALVAPDSPVRVIVDKRSGVEWLAREAGGDLFLLACKATGPTEQVRFSGLPASSAEAEVLYEEPRKVQVKDGVLTDWFAPYEVHVYRLKKQ